MKRAVAGQLQPLVRRRGSSALAEAIEFDVRTTDGDAELADGEATGLLDAAQELCGPEAGALGKLTVTGTAFR